MFTGLELMACQDLAVSAQVMQHIVQVESHGNPYAIGVVGARLRRQPRNLEEALATVHMLDAGSRDYSLGLAQVHRANLEAYGLDSYRQAFMPCANVAAGARILADCYARFGRHWGKAFSCYYSGNPVTGYRDGYVRKIYAAMPPGTGATGIAPAPAGYGLALSSSSASSRQRAPNDRAWRLAIRSTPVDHATGSSTAAGDRSPAPAQAGGPRGETRGTTHASGQVDAVGPSSSQVAIEAFVPLVHGPGDPVPASAHRGLPSSAPAAAVTNHPASSSEHRDAAFVF